MWFPNPFMFGDLGNFGTMPQNYGVPTGGGGGDNEEKRRQMLAMASAIAQSRGGGTGSTSTMTGSSGTMGPPASAQGGWKGFQAKMGLDDPRVRSALAQQLASSPNLQSAIGALAGSQGLAAEYQLRDEEQERLRERLEMEKERFEMEKKERERRAYELERAAELRRREERERDRQNVDRITKKRSYLQDVEELEKAGKIDPGLARIYRRMDPREGSERIRSRFYPTEREKLDDESRRALLGTRASSNEYRQWQMERPRPDTQGRLTTNDQVRTVNSIIDDLQGRLKDMPKWTGDPQERESIEQELEYYFGKRRNLLQQQESGAPAAAGRSSDTSAAPPGGAFHEGTLVGMLEGVDPHPNDTVTKLVQDGKFDEVKRLIQGGMSPAQAILRAYGRI